MKVNRAWFKWLVSIVIWIGYVVALASPAINAFGPLLGIQVLKVGWEGINVVPELANITLIVGWILLMLDELHWAVIVSTLGFLFALSTLALYGSDLLYGYYIWLSCHAVLLFASLLGVVRFGRASSLYLNLS